jgi:hypothetical protein
MVDTLQQVWRYLQLKERTPTVEQCANQIGKWVAWLIKEDKNVVPPAWSMPRIRTPKEALDDLVLAKPMTIAPEFVDLHQAFILNEVKRLLSN